MKIEMHCHSKEVSTDAALSVEELILKHKEKGYHILALTNHFNRSMMNQHKALGINDFQKLYLDTIRKAEAFAKKHDFLVIGGYEIKFDNHKKNELLVYGMPHELSRDCEALFSMTPHEFKKLADEYNFLVYQAHPFRDGMEIIDPRDLYGIEAKNMHPRQDGRNDIAFAWAEKFDLHKISGSDCHLECDIGCSAMLTDREIRTEADFLQMLRDDAYTIQ